MKFRKAGSLHRFEVWWNCGIDTMKGIQVEHPS